MNHDKVSATSSYLTACCLTWNWEDVTNGSKNSLSRKWKGHWWPSWTSKRNTKGLVTVWFGCKSFFYRCFINYSLCPQRPQYHRFSQQSPVSFHNRHNTQNDCAGEGYQGVLGNNIGSHITSRALTIKKGEPMKMWSC